ncbi:DNA repair protein rad2, partial [Cladochytrium tenue]
FLKALRDKDGNASRGAHVLGFFRRICKLLFYNIKPVFVFDGAVAPLKRQTIAARRRRYADAGVRVQKTAERILHQQLRLHALAATSEGSATTGGIPADAVYTDEVMDVPRSRKRKLEIPAAVPQAKKPTTARDVDEFELLSSA